MSDNITSAEFIRRTFKTPVQHWFQGAIILIVALVFIFIPQHEPIDWNLNTDEYWSSFPNSYADPAKVYPPWGLIMMLPYFWMKAVGARVLSVLVIGWLVVKRRWSLVQFLAIVLSPFFGVTMAKSNMDIFVLVLPILLWETAEGTHWQSLGWGTAMSLSLLKPQGMFFVWIYWLWKYRKRWKELLLPLGILALVTVPISLVGSPPLIVQWIHNLLDPTAQNADWWSVNNISLTSRLGLLPSLAIFLLTALVVMAGVRLRKIRWGQDHYYASFLFLSFFLMPYASQQSVSSAFAFIPSWPTLALQLGWILIGIRYLNNIYQLPLAIMFISVAALFFFQPREE